MARRVISAMRWARRRGGQAWTWLDPQRRQKRAVEDKASPQLTHAWTPVSGRFRTSRLEAAHTASAPRGMALGWWDGQAGAVGQDGCAEAAGAGHSGADACVGGLAGKGGCG